MKPNAGRMRRRRWTPEEDEALCQAYPDTRTDVLAKQLGRSVASTYQRADHLGLRKSAAYLAGPDACRLRRGDGAGVATRFAKGHAPANKELRRPGWAPGRMRETQFKPGERRGAAARNWRPVGTVLPDPEGYLRIKVREWRPGERFGFGNPKIWPFLHRHLWTQAHGPIPPGQVVCFKDGNRQHCALDNLELVSRRELMKRNTVHTLPKPLAQVVQLLGALKRQIRRRTDGEEQDRRSA